MPRTPSFLPDEHGYEDKDGVRGRPYENGVRGRPYENGVRGTPYKAGTSRPRR